MVPGFTEERQLGSGASGQVVAGPVSGSCARSLTAGDPGLKYLPDEGRLVPCVGVATLVREAGRELAAQDLAH